MRAAIAHRLCAPPECGGSLRPWAPLIVPPALNERTIQLLVDATTEINCDFLRSHPDTPPIYRSGVWYEKEPPGQEQFLTIPWCLIRRDKGLGCDCDDLAPWRVAELRVRLVEGRARCRVTTHDGGPGVRIYHVDVQRGRTLRGRPWVEDPSENLGMGQDPAAVRARGRAGRAARPDLVERQWRGAPDAPGAWWDTIVDPELGPLDLGALLADD